MFITLPGPLPHHAHVLVTRAGYHRAPSASGDEAYVRRLGGLDYPRFHLYLHPAPAGSLRFRLHLDQKRPSYAGSHAHGGEYAGPLLEAEVERIRRALAS